MKTELIIKNRKGATAVEFAIVLSLLFLLVFGIIDFGFYLYDAHIITNASREGARNGIIQAIPRVSADEIRQKVRDYSEARLVSFANPKPKPSIAVCLDKDNNNICDDDSIDTGCQFSGFGQNLIVEVKYAYTFLLLPSLASGKISPVKTIPARTVMKCE